MLSIKPAETRHHAPICHLILDIEQRELGISITIDDQPDLLDIPNFYQKNRGQFWVAENDLSEVVGTIALIDLGERFGVIRKMFVRADFRGKPHQTGQKLLETLEKWAFSHDFEVLLLGTSDALHAACRFYERNLFVEILQKNLPKTFPIMSVNNVFYQKKLTLKLTIKSCEPAHYPQIPQMILNIQQNEFGVPVTLADQPDLLDIAGFYQKNRGQFWVAENDLGEVVGTIALIDSGRNFGTIRKMFVRADYRGKAFGTGQKLFDTLEKWAIEHGFDELLLGTRDQLEAALRFYERNGFSIILKENLPDGFPLMAVDNVFCVKKL